MPVFRVMSLTGTHRRDPRVALTQTLQFSVSRAQNGSKPSSVFSSRGTLFEISYNFLSS